MDRQQHRTLELPPEQAAIRANCFHPNGTASDFGRDQVEQSLAQRFERTARLHPLRLAAKTDQRSLTYEELNANANRIAWAILDRCGGDAEPVAILFDHDVDMLAAILGVLKAGKIYVPLDSSYPEARLGFMLEDSQARLIVTNQANLAQAHSLSKDARIVMNVDGLARSLPDRNPGSMVGPDSSALIMYTSGSTGQPKGVVQNHRNLLHRIFAYTCDLHICAQDRLSLLSYCSSNMSLRDMFGALLNGACLCPFDVGRQGGARLAQWLLRQGITIYFSTPSVFQQLPDVLSGNDAFPDLRVVHLGGEAVGRKNLEIFQKHFARQCVMLNSLGSAECGTVREHFFDCHSVITDNTLPVGYAVDDKEILLLDEGGKYLESDQVGQIAVRSRYLFPGYWRRPDLTQAVFLPNPPGGQERIYLTGDCGRLRADGCLVYGGRKDFMVKVRGHRVEIQEIESLLANLPMIKDAAVLAREEDGGTSHLTAYIVPRDDVPPQTTELRKLLGEQLPSYMVPTAFVVVDFLPLSPSGKVDRQALALRHDKKRILTADFVAPKSPLEQMLSRIWADVLGLDRVGINDNFHELGGHSLAAMQIVNQIAKQLQIEVSLQSLLGAPTIAKIAGIMNENTARKIAASQSERILAELESLPDETAERLIAGSHLDKPEPKN
jgi:amino acid adenylation domain-containing protein